jgi:hypothetical protein
MLGCLLLISPVYAIGQEMSDAQLRERCENNKKALADYDRQLEAIGARLNLTMNDEELALARANRAFVFNIWKMRFAPSGEVRDEQVAKLEELGTLYEFKGQKSCPQGFKVYNSACLSGLTLLIDRRIDTAKQANTQRDELDRQRTQLQRQRAVHQSRLDELDCDMEIESRCKGFAGTWKTKYGTMTSVRSGNQITASYDFDGGNLRGTISADGRTLTGTYTEISAKGTFRFTLATDGKSFMGNWTRTSGTREPASGIWSGGCASQ